MNALKSSIGATNIGNSYYSPIGISTSIPEKTARSNHWAPLILTTVIGISIVVDNVVDIAALTKFSFDKVKKYSISKDSSWISADVLNWLNTHAMNASNDMNALRVLIAEVFGSATVTTEMYVDPDESWSKVLLKIDSNLGDDFDKQIHLEDQLFSAIWKSTSLKTLSQSLIITQS